MKKAVFHRLGGVVLPLFATHQGSAAPVPLRLPLIIRFDYKYNAEPFTARPTLFISEGLLIIVGRDGIEPPNQSKI